MPGTNVRQRRRRLAHHRFHDVPDLLAGERLAVRDQLVEQHADRKNVAAPIDAAALELLRRHVVGRAQHHAGLGHRDVADARDAEIENLDHALAIGHHVGGFDVAVDDAFVVRVVEAAGHLLDDLELAPHRNRDAVVDLLRERDPLDVLHHDVGLTFVLAEVENGDDVAVGEVADRLRFLDEPICEATRRECSAA